MQDTSKYKFYLFKNVSMEYVAKAIFIILQSLPIIEILQSQTSTIHNQFLAYSSTTNFRTLKSSIKLEHDLEKYTNYNCGDTP